MGILQVRLGFIERFAVSLHTGHLLQPSDVPSLLYWLINGSKIHEGEATRSD